MPRKPIRRDPSDVGGTTPAGAAKPRSQPAARGKSAKVKTQRDEGPLESLGKAVSSPVRGTADEEEGEKPA